MDRQVLEVHARIVSFYAKEFFIARGRFREVRREKCRVSIGYLQAKISFYLKRFSCHSDTYCIV